MSDLHSTGGEQTQHHTTAETLVARAERAEAEVQQWRAHHCQPRCHTRCPSCDHDTLFIAMGGHLTCSWHTCPEPGLARAIAAKDAALAAMTQEREELKAELNCERREVIGAIGRKEAALRDAAVQRARADAAEQSLAEVRGALEAASHVMMQAVNEASLTGDPVAMTGILNAYLMAPLLDAIDKTPAPRRTEVG